MSFSSPPQEKRSLGSLLEAVRVGVVERLLRVGAAVARPDPLLELLDLLLGQQSAGLAVVDDPVPKRIGPGVIRDGGGQWPHLFLLVRIWNSGEWLRKAFSGHRA